MDIGRKIQAFSHLGNVLGTVTRFEGEELLPSWGEDEQLLNALLYSSKLGNAWFTPGFVRKAFESISTMLDEDSLRQWVAGYDDKMPAERKKVAVVMAGNVPAVGFHDFLSVMMAGHSILAKLSSEDKFLIPAMADVLIRFDQDFDELIQFTDEKISDFDAVIATGSNNTARYFEYYFGKYPHIIRKNRNAVAVLDGTENEDQLTQLGDDIFLYFGLGCRNVSKLYIPEGFDVRTILPKLEKWSWIGDHHKYRNNYDYNKSLFLVNGDHHFDNGFLLIRESAALVSPVSVLNYEYYKNKDSLKNTLMQSLNEIQCIVSDTNILDATVPIGAAQFPKLWDYADGVDTMEFLKGMS